MVLNGVAKIFIRILVQEAPFDIADIVRQILVQVTACKVSKYIDTVHVAPCDVSKKLHSLSKFGKGGEYFCIWHTWRLLALQL